MPKARHKRAVLHVALDIAWKANCYKVMLATGSKQEATLRFYESAGFMKGGKTYFEARRVLNQRSMAALGVLLTDLLGGATERSRLPQEAGGPRREDPEALGRPWYQRRDIETWVDAQRQPARAGEVALPRGCCGQSGLQTGQRHRVHSGDCRRWSATSLPDGAFPSAQTPDGINHHEPEPFRTVGRSARRHT